MNIKKVLKKYQIAFIIIIMIIIATIVWYCAAYYKSKTYDWAKQHNNNYQSGLDFLEKTGNEQKQQFDKDNLKTLDSVDTSQVDLSE